MMTDLVNERLLSASRSQNNKTRNMSLLFIFLRYFYKKYLIRYVLLQV